MLALSGDSGALALPAGVVSWLRACPQLATAQGLRDGPADHRPTPGAAAAAPAPNPAAAVAADNRRRRRAVASRRNAKLCSLTPASVPARGPLARSALAPRPRPRPRRARRRPGLGPHAGPGPRQRAGPLDSLSRCAGLDAMRPFLQAERILVCCSLAANAATDSRFRPRLLRKLCRLPARVPTNATQMPELLSQFRQDQTMHFVPIYFPHCAASQFHRKRLAFQQVGFPTIRQARRHRRRRQRVHFHAFPFAQPSTT